MHGNAGILFLHGEKMSQGDVYSQVPPLPPRFRLRDLILGDNSPADSDRVRVEFFTNEKSFKERLQLYFIKNQRSSLRIRIFNLVIKLLTCILYTVRVLTENLPPDCDSLPDTISTNNGSSVAEEVNCWKSIEKDEFQENPTIHWDHILWVDRHNVLLFVQVTVAVISLSETILVQYLSYKGNILQQILSVEFILELFLTVPFIITIFWAPLRRLFIPVFLNCWLAKQSMQNMFNDLHRVMQKSQSALAQQLMILCATLICLVFISACGIQHLQRGGNKQLDLFEACYFTIVTLSTVGYGDIHPDIWPSRLWMLCMIVAALLVLPTQFEQLAYTWMERQKQGGAYSSHRAQTEKHVVVCTTTLQADTIMDFLNEFYSHPKLQDYFVVLLSPCELDPTMKVLLQVPMWAQRVIFIQGSALKDTDLARCRVQDAEACFILSTQNVENKEAADQHTIMRSWAIKDFAPECPQYVQIFRPENKFHVKFAEHVVCVDEFKYALLANNCLCPATSTLVTLLLHTSRGQEGQGSSEEWQHLYGKCSGNEIYHIRLGESKFFGEYKGKSFTYASFHAHRKYGVSLVGVQQNSGVSTIQLNPGPRHIMKESDICFYMNITKEENSAFILAHPNQEESKTDRKLMQGGEHTSKVASVIASVGTMALELQHTRLINAPPDIKRTGSRRTKLDLPAGLSAQHLQKRPSIAPVPALIEASDITIQVEEETLSEDSLPYGDEEDNPEYVRGFPPVTPYIGTSPTLCHLMREKRPLCCLQLVQLCDHCSFNNAKQYHWPNPAIIVAADYASNGLYNFIVPLRSHARPSNTLNAIVLLLEKRPDTTFLETICHFPMVYWMLGSIDAIDDLLRAGINLADNVVIVNKESSNSQEEETLADCNTIVAVQSIFRLFPSANIITELTQSSNMRFMQFQANDSYSYELSKQEKKEKERGSHISYMFRLPFAAGNVFSASMLDTLLYQAFVKDYLITFVRLLLGIDQAVGSGHLSCMKITKDDLWIRTYGRLYQKLCSTTCEIPIGIYRTQIKLCRSPPANTSALEYFIAKKGTRNASFMSRDQSALNLAFRNSVRGRTYRSQNGVSLNMMTGSERHEDHSGQVNPELHEISQMVKCRMQSIGQPLDDYDEKNEKRDTISYVVINPGYDLQLKLGDVVYLIRPSSLSPKPSPLIDERKQMQHHVNGKREEPTGADNSEIQAADTVVRTKGRIVKDGNNRIPIIYMDDSDSDEMTENDKTTSENTERNKNIPTFDLMTDDENDEEQNETCNHSNHISRSDSLEPPVIAVKGTVV